MHKEDSHGKVILHITTSLIAPALVARFFHSHPQWIVDIAVLATVLKRGRVRLLQSGLQVETCRQVGGAINSRPKAM
jgi:hypothetical protein